MISLQKRIRNYANAIRPSMPAMADDLDAIIGFDAVAVPRCDPLDLRCECGKIVVAEVPHAFGEALAEKVRRHTDAKYEEALAKMQAILKRAAQPESVECSACEDDANLATEAAELLEGFGIMVTR